MLFFFKGGGGHVMLAGFVAFCVLTQWHKGSRADLHWCLIVKLFI